MVYLQLASGSGGSSFGTVLGAIGGALPIVGGIVSTLINNHDTAVNNATNENFQLQQQQDQDAYNTQMWDDQNAYNAPAAQMSRLEDAGLNPNLVYGSGNVTGNVAEAAPSMAKVDFVSQPMRAPDLSTDITEGLSAYNNLKLGVAQTDNLAAQTQLNQSTSALQSTQASLNSANTAKVNQDITLAPAVQAATVANLTSASFKNNVDAQVASSMLPLQQQLASGQLKQIAADTSATLSNAAQNVIQTATNLRTATAQIANWAIQNSKVPSEIANIQASTTLLMGNKTFQDMDQSMRNQGMMPSDSAFQRAISAVMSLITGKNNAGGIDPGDNPTSPETAPHWSSNNSYPAY